MAEEDILPLLAINIPPDDDDSSDSNSDGSHAEEMDENMADEEDDDDDDVEGAKPSESRSFDQALPSSHSYLGTDLEEISGRTILDDDMEIELPLVTLPGTILVPGHIIPLYSHNQHEVAMLKGVVDSPHKTFGVVALRYEEHRHVIASIGTTAEIYSVKNEMHEGSGISTITVLAQGRQRFELVNYRRTITGVLLGQVKILPETELGDMLEGIRPPMHCRLCSPGNEDEEDVKVAMDKQGRILSCVRMRPKRKELLMKRIKMELQKWDVTLQPNKLPSDCTKLSYWVTQNLPVNDTLKLHLLSINSAVQRLRCALGIMEKCSVLCCHRCTREVTSMSSMFSMSVSGPLSAYVNPGGHVHETVTVHHVKNLSLYGRPSTEHSWFPGYAWTIAQCKRCSNHMGWKFTATRKDLQPQKFWGLCRTSLAPGISDPDENPDVASWTPRYTSV
ncbi:CRBN-like protein [Mya arenaria]|uniref:Protein cereblon n=1 Tax=Mya arenaria TaxID=6604 RepID=A0ABY7FTJ7_MYAAR|nr:CRBN-like protein [Mya arenaria]